MDPVNVMDKKEAELQDKGEKRLLEKKKNKVARVKNVSKGDTNHEVSVNGFADTINVTEKKEAGKQDEGEKRLAKQGNTLAKALQATKGDKTYEDPVNVTEMEEGHKRLPEKKENKTVEVKIVTEKREIEQQDEGEQKLLEKQENKLAKAQHETKGGKKHEDPVSVTEKEEGDKRLLEQKKSKSVEHTTKGDKKHAPRQRDGEGRRSQVVAKEE